jgi:hypothetical protein
MPGKSSIVAHAAENAADVSGGRVEDQYMSPEMSQKLHAENPWMGQYGGADKTVNSEEDMISLMTGWFKDDKMDTQAQKMLPHLPPEVRRDMAAGLVQKNKDWGTYKVPFTDTTIDPMDDKRVNAMLQMIRQGLQPQPQA